MLLHCCNIRCYTILYYKCMFRQDWHMDRQAVQRLRSTCAVLSERAANQLRCNNNNNNNDNTNDNITIIIMITISLASWTDAPDANCHISLHAAESFGRLALSLAGHPRADGVSCPIEMCTYIYIYMYIYIYIYMYPSADPRGEPPRKGLGRGQSGSTLYC